MNPTPNFKGVLFDLDGTLIDSLQDIANAMNTVLERNGYPAHPVEDYTHHVGDGMDMLARRVLPPDIAEDPDVRARLVAEMKEIYADSWHHFSVPYPGIDELLDTLSGLPLKLGVLSNKPDEFTTLMVKHFFPRVAWATVRGARPGVPVKPAPDAALEIAEEWACSPETLLFAGDTSTDIRTAVNAGMPCVGVTWGFRDREELRSSGADWIVDHPVEISERLTRAPSRSF